MTVDQSAQRNHLSACLSFRLNGAHLDYFRIADKPLTMRL
jgi:hypothetical protein